MTQHGFIEDKPRAIENYKTQHKERWLNLLGSVNFDLIEEGDLEEDKISTTLLD
jgi:hypothetical protein